MPDAGYHLLFNRAGLVVLRAADPAVSLWIVRLGPVVVGFSPANRWVEVTRAKAAE